VRRIIATGGIDEMLIGTQRLSVSASAIWYSLMLRRNITSGLLTIQEFRDDEVIYHYRCVHLAVSQQWPLDTLRRAR
jgi:hypothetical protein